MPPKKGGGGAAGADEEDVSCDNFWKHYRKNCATLEIPVNPEIKRLFEEYIEEGKVISKVSAVILCFLI